MSVGEPDNAGLTSRSRSTAEAVRIFVSGRLVWLILGLAFQLIVVRVLSLNEFVAFTTASALALLLQWLFVFSVPRLLAKVGSSFTASNDAIGLGRFLRRIVFARLAIFAVAMGVAAIVAVAVPAITATDFSPGLLLATIAWSLALTIQADAEAVGQLLMQQRLGRVVAMVEPAIRVIALLVMAGSPWANATAVVALSAVTSLGASIALLSTAVIWHRRAVASQSTPSGAAPSFGALARMALSGQASSFGALFVSPATVRLVAASALPAEAFAAFAFVQGLIVSALRFTPSLMLTSLIEPIVMTEHARSGSPQRLEAQLGLVFKLELIVWCAVTAGLMASSAALLDVLSGGRFEGYDLLLPALVPLLLLYGLYRSFETAAFAVGVVAVLGATFFVGAAGLGALLLLAPLGMVAILAVPYCEAALRLLLVGYALRRRGVGKVVDVPMALVAFGIAAIVGFGVRSVAGGVPTLAGLLIGAAAAMATAALILLARPFRRQEVDILPAGSRLRAAAERATRAR